jgi:hypothetical protein
VDEAADAGVEIYSSVQDEVLESSGEFVGEAVDWEDSGLFEVTPPTDDTELLAYDMLLGTDNPKEDE